MKNNKILLMRDVAKEAGVAPATVSRAFNSRLTHLVKEKTRKKIFQTAKKLNYQPNRFARALGGGQTGTIALIFPPTLHFVESVYDIRVIVHTVQALQKYGVDLKVHFLEKQEVGANVAGLRHRLAVDGLIFAGHPLQNKVNISDSEEGKHVIFLNSYKEINVFSIDADNLNGGALAAKCFIQNGHTNLGMLCGRKDSQNAVDRTQGYRRQIESDNIRLREEWFITCDYGIKDGYEAVLSLVKRKLRPTALFCASDEIALGALSAIKDSGLNCPKDVSIIGFDNSTAIKHTSPPLTSIDQPVYQMARAAVECLLKETANKEPGTSMIFPVKLIERESVFRMN